MSTYKSIIPSSPDDLETAERALTQRPRESIRLRLAMLFVATFLSICVVAGAALIFLSKLDVKQQFIEKADNYAAQIQQARRFEKNFLLYGTGLDDALASTDNALRLFRAADEEFRRTISQTAYTRMADNLDRYSGLLTQLWQMKTSQGQGANQQLSTVLDELRHCGALLVTEAADTADKERLRFHHWLHSAKIIAGTALGLILLVEAYIIFFIFKQIFIPFKRFETYMRRIAGGDFSPVTPVKKFQDEFTDLAVAINRMLKEIQDRGNQLLETRKMTAIGTLTAGIAHEINNPLNNISLTAESLIDDFHDLPDTEKIDMLKDIFSQVERAGATVANLLDFTHRDQSAFTPLFINDVLASTLALLNDELQRNNIRLSLNLSEALPTISGHRQNLQQVFLNLLINAEEAMPNGGVLTVHSYLHEDHVRIDIGDTGMGIAEKDLLHIFDPFFTTKAVGRGTGLGLSVSFGIIEKHNGAIKVKSDPGKGSVFSVLLPIGGH